LKSSIARYGILYELLEIVSGIGRRTDAGRLESIGRHQPFLAED
jgi:hypothetical protein